MSPDHLANLAVHVGAGTLALAVGFALLAMRKATLTHRRWGKVFCVFALVVSLSAAIGTVFFRFIPMFAVLTVLVPYQLVSGWRSIYTRDRGPSRFDALWTLAALAFALALTPALLSPSNDAGIVAYASLGALFTLLAYDTVRWCFPRRWFASLWRYDHVYKLVASLFGLLSAFVGNVVRVGQPWSQIAPSAIGLLVILCFFVQLRRRGTGSAAIAPTRAVP
ncbi:MAG: hypothetical protein JNJ62_09350 [Pseudoxanthomonas mexicana]|nr:hypothetical protein [Pseudoxanthomonas mexicana]